MIIESHSLISEYATKSRACGLNNHNKNKIQKSLQGDFKEIIEGVKYDSFTD